MEWKWKQEVTCAGEGNILLRSPRPFIHSFIPLACVECDDSLPFAGASSIPLCYVFFPVTLLHQLFFHPPSLHPAIYFLIYLSILLFPYSHIILFWDRQVIIKMCVTSMCYKLDWTNLIYIQRESLCKDSDEHFVSTAKGNIPNIQVIINCWWKT
jgi:hypothetical protein